MKKVIMNQILGTLMFFFVFSVFTFMAVGTKDTIMIVASVILGVLTLLFALNSIKVIKREKGIKIKHDINYTFFICLIIICSIFGVCLSLLIKNISYKINGVETTATVYEVDKTINYKTEYDDDGTAYEKKEEKCKVYINYNVDNQEYNNKLDVDTCKYDEGDEIKIYYDKDNPNDFVSNSITILLIATIFTGLALLIFIIQSIKSLKKKSKSKVRK